MKRRDFCQATMAAGVATAFPGGHVLAALQQKLTEVISDIPAITSSGGEIVLERAAIGELFARSLEEDLAQASSPELQSRG